MDPKKPFEVFAAICLGRNEEDMKRFLDRTPPKACAELLNCPHPAPLQEKLWGKQQVLKHVLGQPRLDHVHLVNMPQYLCALDKSILLPLWSTVLDALVFQPQPVQSEVLNAVLTHPQPTPTRQYDLALTLCTHPQTTRYNRFKNDVVFRWCEAFHFDHPPDLEPLWSAVQETISPEEMNEVMRWAHRDRLYFSALSHTPPPVDHWLSVCDLKPASWKAACVALWEQTKTTLLDHESFGIQVPEFEAWTEKTELWACVNPPASWSSLRKL